MTVAHFTRVLLNTTVAFTTRDLQPIGMVFLTMPDTTLNSWCEQEQKKELERLGNSNALLEFRCDAAEARAEPLQAEAAEAANKHAQEAASLKGESNLCLFEYPLAFYSIR